MAAALKAPDTAVPAKTVTDKTVTAETVTDHTPDDADTAALPQFFARRGRHRRRPHRKAMLAAGGLALAAGALSLVRLAPETGIPGLGPADPADVPDLAIDAGDHGTGTGTDRSTEAAATLPADRTRTRPSPSATSAMGGLGTTPSAGSILVPTATAGGTRSSAPGATDDAETPVRPPEAPPAATEPSRPAPTTPQHPPAPGRPTASPTSAPAPQPSEPDDRGICVPVIGLCIDLFGSRGGQG